MGVHVPGTHYPWTHTMPEKVLRRRPPCLLHEHESVELGVCVPAAAKPCRTPEAATLEHRWAGGGISSNAEVFCSRQMLGNGKFLSIPVETVRLKEEVFADSDGWWFCWKTITSRFPVCNWEASWNQIVLRNSSLVLLAPTWIRIERNPRSHPCRCPILCVAWNASMASDCNRTVPQPNVLYPSQWWWTYPPRIQIDWPQSHQFFVFLMSSQTLKFRFSGWMIVCNQIGRT